MLDEMGNALAFDTKINNKRHIYYKLYLIAIDASILVPRYDSSCWDSTNMMFHQNFEKPNTV